MSLMKKGQRGAGLLEVLIAFLLLSIGGVGLASMQLKAKRLSYEAVQRSVANALARDVIERMRNNPEVLANYVVNNLGASSLGDEPEPNCRTAACTTVQLAAHDLWEWERALDGANEVIADGTETVFAGGLATPRACITHADGLVTVAVAWKGFQELGSPESNSCGEGLGLYGEDDAARQVVFITTFIDEI